MRQAGAIGLVLVLLTGFGVAARHARPATAGLEAPARLTDQQLWALMTSSSEPGGYFRNENITNLTSNELGFEDVIPDLVATAKPDRAYLGVGPEQNFTYIAALRPSMAVIIDVRRGNLDLQLMYKALFELAADRADFISLLFARHRPVGLGAASSAAELFGAFGAVPEDAAFARSTLGAIESTLTKTHGLPLPADDLSSLEQIYGTFVASGFAVRPSPTYADLMTATDAAGAYRSFLASEEAFAVLKGLESRNLVVPVVGDFGGPKAIRAVGKYLSDHQMLVGAFYLSNVEQYLVQDGTWDTFCRSVATLPLDRSSTFIRSSMGRGMSGFGGGFVSSLGDMTEEVRACH